MTRTNENAPGEGGVNTTRIYTSKDTARRTIRQRVQRWLCRVLCPSEFFNADASREIDRLTVEVERLRAKSADTRAE
ncbi:MAG: hypothetical protein EXR31_06025 [Betaproteobacteria bacterium]|nr:hypothetical protein [Betaproteobacteria bacterium]